MIDTLLKNVARVSAKDFVPSDAVRVVCQPGKRYAVLTLHRPYNVDAKEALAPIWEAISEVARQVPILFPVHPRTRSRISAFGLDATGFTLIDPIGYFDMLFAVKGAGLVLTDSGGLQEETTALGVPCVTIRENTERPVTVELGTNVLAGNKKPAVLAAYRQAVNGGKKGSVPPLWDGRASERIWGVLLGDQRSADS